MGWKSNTLTVLTIAGLTVGALTALEPKTANERQQELHDQWSETDEKTKDRKRQEGQELQDAVNRDGLRPGEHRQPELKIRIRP